MVYVDETGWWLGGDREYLHVFCTENTVLFQVADRSNQTALEVLGDVKPPIPKSSFDVRRLATSRRHLPFRQALITFLGKKMMISMQVVMLMLELLVGNRPCFGIQNGNHEREQASPRAEYTTV